MPTPNLNIVHYLSTSYANSCTKFTKEPYCVMRLDDREKKALKFALKGFKGKIYLFGSRVSAAKKGGDIDLLLIPERKVNSLKLSLKIQTRFFSLCEEKLDVIVDDDSLFCKEVLKHAERLIIERI